MIGIFFSLTEIAMGYALTQLDPGFERWILLSFSILFPTIITITFFVFLWIKPENLTSPRDYDDQRLYLDAISATSKIDEFQKTVHEFKETIDSDDLVVKFSESAPPDNPAARKAYDQARRLDKQLEDIKNELKNPEHLSPSKIRGYIELARLFEKK